MASLQRMRTRMPLLVFVLVAIICLVLLGLACACATDHPAQKIERALSTISATPALVEVWTFAFGSLLVFVALDVRRRRADHAPSPAFLQCFLF